MTRAAPLAWVVLLAACGGGGGPSTGTASVGGHFVAHPAITHVSVLQGGAIWWDCTRAAPDATSPSVLLNGAQVQIRAYFSAAPGASASLVDSCGGAIAPAGSSPGGGGVDAYATFDWTAPASPSACILTPRVTVPGPPAGPLEDAFPIVVRVGTPAAAHLGTLASRLTAASGVSRVAAAVAGLTQDLAYVPANGTFSGTIASVPAGPQTVTATAYGAGSQPVGTGSGEATVVAGATVPVSVTVYDTTGPPAVPDHGPVVLALGVQAATATVGASQTLSATAMDADPGDAITFAWSTTPDGCGTFSGSTATATTASTQWTAAIAGTCTVTVTVTSNGKSDARSADIHVVLPALSIAPDPASVALDAAQQFTVSPALPVTWSVNAVAGPPPPPTAFPVQVSADGRYVVDQTGRPWRIQADAAWTMSSNATPSDVDAYLAARKAQGFNAFYLMGAVHQNGYWNTPNAPNNYLGDPPFTTPGDFSTPGAAYWNWIELIVDKAAAQGFAVMLAYTYLGFHDTPQGWYLEAAAQSVETNYGWGVWLGNRFKSKSNVIWFGLGDFEPPQGSAGSQRVRAIIDGIRSTASQLWMAELNGPDAIPTQSIDFGDVFDMNSFYGYGPGGLGASYVTADTAYRISPPVPAWIEEGLYENESNNPAVWIGAAWETRRQRYWCVLAGGTAGDGFGSAEPYHWSNIPASLGSDGAVYSRIAYEFFATLPWWRLRPSGVGDGFAGKVLVTAGTGTWGQLDYVTSAATDEGSLLLAYVPTIGGTAARTITIDMTAMRGPSRARWFNPATGEYTVIVGPGPGGTFPNDAPRPFTTPGNNGTGTNDWVLVLDEGDAPCGRIDATGLYVAPSTIPAGVECQVVATLEADPSVVARATVSLHH